MKKISAVYKITNTITGDFYIGSSKDVKHRWYIHRSPSTWKNKSNPMYQDMQKYGLDSFKFEIIMQLDDDYMRKSTEQELIEYLKPTYNRIGAKRRFGDKRTYDVYYSRIKRARKCIYNNEELTYSALSQRFKKQGFKHPFVEATKYLIKEK